MQCQSCGKEITGPLAQHQCAASAPGVIAPADTEDAPLFSEAPAPAPAYHDAIERQPVLPLKAVNLERVYTYWLWYMAPFNKPAVSDACAKWIEAGMPEGPSENQIRSWQRVLVTANTVRADAAQAIVRKPGSLAVDREQYRRKGFTICQRAEGEVGSGEFPFRAWRVEVTRRYDGVYCCEEIVAELARRLPWAIAQVTARIADTERRMEQRGVTANQMDYLETTLGKLNERLLTLQSQPTPYASELGAFFAQFDALVLEARQDVRMKEQLDITNKVAGLNAEAAALLAQAREQGAGERELASAGVV